LKSSQKKGTPKDANGKKKKKACGTGLDGQPSSKSPGEEKEKETFRQKDKSTTNPNHSAKRGP